MWAPACAAEATNDPLGKPGALSMLGFLHILKKCNVPHPDIPMAAFDRIFVEVNWSSDPAVRHSHSTQSSRCSLGVRVTAIACCNYCTSLVAAA